MAQARVPESMSWRSRWCSDYRDAGRRAVAGAAVPALGAILTGFLLLAFWRISRELQPAAGRGLQLLPVGEAGGGPGLLISDGSCCCWGAGGNLVAASESLRSAILVLARGGGSHWFRTEAAVRQTA